VVRGALITHEGKKTWPPPKPPEPSPTEAKKPEPAPAPVPTPRSVKKGGHGQKEAGSPVWLLVAGLALLGVGIGAPPSFLAHFTVFVLAIFVGWQVIWNVSPALRTPLMSVTNAISGIIIIGGMLQVSGAPMSATVILGAAAILVATINIAGGFL